MDEIKILKLLKRKINKLLEGKQTSLNQFQKIQKTNIDLVQLGKTIVIDANNRGITLKKIVKTIYLYTVEEVLEATSGELIFIQQNKRKVNQLTIKIQNDINNLPLKEVINIITKVHSHYDFKIDRKTYIKQIIDMYFENKKNLTQEQNINTKNKILSKEP